MSFSKPTCLALILCDNVIEGKMTNNKSLIGLFNRILARQLPAVHPRMFVVISLSNGRGKTPVKLQISNLANHEEIFHANGEVEFNDPLAVCDLVFELRQVPFKSEGAYAITVFHENHLLIERRFIVDVLKEAKK
jgi:hypothetical protein